MDLGDPLSSIFAERFRCLCSFPFLSFNQFFYEFLSDTLVSSFTASLRGVGNYEPC